MESLLVNKILSTEKYSVNQIFESKGKVYTFLNPVSYLTALDNKELFSYAEEHGKAIYIVASKQEQVEKAVEIFRERYPKVKFAGYRNGYFASENEMDVDAKHIVKLGTSYP